MYVIEYTLPLIGDGFQITSYDTSVVRNQKDALPIKMTVITCVSKSGVASVSDAINLDNGKLKRFICHCQEILAGSDKTWKLISVRVDAKTLKLYYYNSKTREIEYIPLSIMGTKINNLDLQLEVPHSDHRPPTKYIIRMSQMPIPGSPLHTFVEVYLPTQKKIFAFAPNKPDEIAVTEYSDL